MPTLDHIPPPLELKFWPAPPPLLEKKNADWVLEIGPGKGELLLHLAQSQASTQFAAVEIRRMRFEKIARQAEKLKLGNLHLIWGDARECLPRLFPKNSLNQVYILFPDPWPKARHAKHRLLKPRFIQELKEMLKSGGSVVSATDAGFYSKQIVYSFSEVGGFETSQASSPYPTYFEKKWLRDQREINYWDFKKL